MKKNQKSNRSDSSVNSVRQAHEDYTPENRPDDVLKERFTSRLLNSIDYKAILPRFLILLSPALLALLSGVFLKNDMADFFCWWGILYLYGWAAFPIVAHFFRGFVSAGYSFSRSLGILLTTGPLWLISYLGIWRSFNRPMTWIMFFLLAAVCWGIPKTRDAAVEALSDNSNITHILWEEALFIAILIFFCFCKGIYPTIDGEEKFMNFGFMNSMVRYDGLPAKDPWLAGHSINYYYYGQYLFSYLVKMLGIRTEVGYTLSMCTAIALPFSTAYGLGQLFIDGLRQKKDCQVSKNYLPFAGLLAALCTMIFGNSHSFFYDEQSFGNKMLFWKIWNKLGINVGKTGDFFYPNSTRFIGHNPNLKELGLAEHGDNTIHEFPFYSYLIGDLHAHVVSLTIVLLIIAFIFVAVYRAKYPPKPDMKMYHFRDLKKSLVSQMDFLFKPEFFFCAYLLGLTQMCNYWDFLFYFIFCAMGILVYQGRRSTYLLTFSSFLVFLFELGSILIVFLKFGDKVFAHLCLQVLIFVISFILSSCFPSAFSRTGAAMSMLFAMASAISLSFNLHFEMISNMIALVDRHTSLFQFLIVWLMHLLIPLSLVILVVGTTRHAFHKNKLPTVPGPLSLTRPSFNKAFAYQGASRSSASGNTSSGTRFTSSDAKSTFSGADSSFSEEADPSVENAASSNGTAKDSIVDPDGAFIDPDLAEIVSRSSDQTSSVSDEDASLSSTDKTAETGNKDAENNTPVSAPGFLVPILTFLSYLDYQFARFGDFLLCKFFRKRSIIDIFMVGMTFVGFLLLLAPEIIYVRDIYGIDNQRSNTMFKFTFSGFVILSLVIAYTIFRFMAHVTRQGNLSNWGLSVSIIMILLMLFIPGHYTLRSLDQRTGDIKLSAYKGLDGTAYLPECIPTEYTFSDKSKRVAGIMTPYEEAIDWLNENEKGSRNICEAYGYSYTERCIVSAYTGLPTVIGWQTHEWLWHFQGWINPETGVFEDDPEHDARQMYVYPRYEDVAKIYTCTDVTEVFRLLHLYDITYVICGSMELDQFGIIYYPCLNQLGTPVFTSSDGSLIIYKVQ